MNCQETQDTRVQNVLFSAVKYNEIQIYMIFTSFEEMQLIRMVNMKLKQNSMGFVYTNMFLSEVVQDWLVKKWIYQNKVEICKNVFIVDDKKWVRGEVRIDVTDWMLTRCYLPR